MPGYNNLIMRWFVCLLFVLGPVTVTVGDVLRGHAIAMFDNEIPRYPAGFTHFDY
ncbi:MAG: hypothetical protein HOF85_14800, partial [Acidiferrobacteraceae bacterium]|nr:hypothetical protein [Acidiferrobacteraceae bacterium]